ncbi:biotin holocarboxylase synthetase [Conoideocrella luteorostrata]|uniref:Biotin holocarboxylase synthetase n=1 Tax=Conoideocrella luteorostrata TaxID=1105319 RepID=A0AAJ0CTU8_9HYPO|nr:biotin holocarboxylase synthetase [Conoideocrella luteorostrata]
MTPARRLNVLVYTGTGTTSESVRQCMYTLPRLLSPNYAVIPISESVILKEPWAPTCALLVIPGGADLGYCRVLNGEGNRRISEFVRRGGAYLGLCAGAYYGSRRCEFEVGNKPLEVIGSRELGFFPGTCRGGAFKGFEYHSEKGARAAILRVTDGAFKNNTTETFASYYNGGGVFVDVDKVTGRKVEVLASYDDDLDVDGGDGKAAALVLCHVGDGKVLLSGPHPEFSPANLSPQPGIPGYADLINKLREDDSARFGFLKGCLEKLGLEVSAENATLPTLSNIHLSAVENTQVSELLCAWGEVTEKENGEEYIKCEADVFRIRSDEDSLTVQDLQRDLPGADDHPADEAGIIDYGTVTKNIIAHEKALPTTEMTPRFNHKLYYSSLKRFQLTEDASENWGNMLMYGDVVTSTNSLLEKNPKLISKLPTGFTFCASTQVAGRGRGTNVWLAPPGSLLFSTIINHPAYLAASRPVVFIQYIAAIAIVEAIQSYDVGYENLPIKLKWPNDIYALDPTKPASSKTYVKIGGILSQCGYCDGSYQIVLGIGINAINPRPTTSISDLLPSHASPLRIETLLARIVTRLESLHAQFRREGFTEMLERRYYRHWLHTGQAVSLEAEAGARARVLGITRDWGMLKVEETDGEGRGTGRIWTLQSDENSFDFWKGLVRRRQ